MKRPKCYRKIWEDCFGPIPVDENGRSYEIHHIDRDPYNNDISNLRCLSIEDHYLEHLRAGEHHAALAIASRMSVSHEIISALASLAHKNKMFITDGVNDRRIDKSEMILEGWHPGRTKGKRYGKRSKEFCEKMKLVNLGRTLSEEHKQNLKIAASKRKARNHSEETKRKISIANSGKVRSIQSKENMSRSRLGISNGPHTEETKRKISNTKRQKNARN